MSVPHNLRSVYPNHQPQLRLVLPPAPAASAPAIAPAGPRPRGRRELAYDTGFRDGLAGVDRSEYYQGSELRIEFERGYQHGNQTRASRLGENIGILGMPREVPATVDESYHPEFLAGWERGNLIHRGHAEDLDEAHGLIAWLHN